MVVLYVLLFLTLIIILINVFTKKYSYQIDLNEFNFDAKEFYYWYNYIYGGLSLDTDITDAILKDYIRYKEDIFPGEELILINDNDTFKKWKKQIQTL